MTNLTAVVDLEEYLRRIGYSGTASPTLDVLHRIVEAHAQTIPFENLDVLLDRPIRLDPEAIFKKLVHDRRGGYCFEQNGLLLHMLSAMGFRATPLSARVRLQRPRSVVPPRTHLFVGVDIDGERWLADVGIGGVSLTSAIRLDTDEEQQTPHEPRRIVREGGVLFHQVRFADGWADVCEFTLEEMPLIDRELANWYTSAHPQSHFRSRLIVSRAAPEGQRMTISNREFSVRDRNGRATVTAIDSPAELLELLESKFGLCFPAGTTFGAPDSAWPS